MTAESSQKKSALIQVLREGIGVVQMVIFKELRTSFAKKYRERDITSRSMLVGAIINKMFGMENPEPKFQKFNQENKAVIEQELIDLSRNHPDLLNRITDALRVQVLCDNQEGEDSTAVLQQAEEFGFLVKDREIPLPSTFMTLIRRLGEEHGLTVAPVQINTEDDSLIQ
ncbi:MAG: hypothetical protein QNJ17_08550 [Desulfocapsaceae bacterium]|nr:hypothetical protein [Desulfocapsaceae bacterium]